MPPPIAVTLVPHDPRWTALAAAEATRIGRLAAEDLHIEHIGSTAIPDIAAKPVIDLLGIAPSLAALDALRPAFAVLGYAWHGEYGLTGRRYATLTDGETGSRRVQFHGYAAGDRRSPVTWRFAIISARTPHSLPIMRARRRDARRCIPTTATPTPIARATGSGAPRQRRSELGRSASRGRGRARDRGRAGGRSG